MEVFLDGFELSEPTTTNDTLLYSMDNIDILVSLCEIARHKFCLLKQTEFCKAFVNAHLKHHNSMSKGEKERCMNIIFQVWNSSRDGDAFYQGLISRICMSKGVAVYLIELLNDMNVSTDVVEFVPL